MAIKTIKLVISGRVQGVGFRAWTKSTAERLGLKGYVRNLPSGSVEAVIRGDNGVVDAMLELCRKGPLPAKVREVDINIINQDELYLNFEIR